jgi:cephalosporin-C deacetylase-like acetyl esterase
MDEISLPKFPHLSLGFDKKCKIDNKRFILAGHSFGGCTAIKVGDSDSRVAAVLTLDPWLMPIKDLIERDQLKDVY